MEEVTGSTPVDPTNEVLSCKCYEGAVTQAKRKPRAPKGRTGAKLVFADVEGNLYDHPTLEAAVCVVDKPRRAEPGTFRALPSNGASSSVSALPGRLPVGVDPDTGRLEVLESIVVNGKQIRPVAVAALFAQGWTRSQLTRFKRSGRDQVLHV